MYDSVGGKGRFGCQQAESFGNLTLGRMWQLEKHHQDVKCADFNGTPSALKSFQSSETL
jgi:hypothetical protein